MKKLYLLLFFAFSFVTNAQIVNIPDANFKALLLSASSSNTIASTQTTDENGQVSTYNSIDTNSDGEIEVAEAVVIKYLKVYNSNITDLDGIQYFTNLVKLECLLNSLTSINTSNLLNLKYLNCALNQITSLDVSNNVLLKNLACNNNQLVNLDISQNTALTYLQCSSNPLMNIDVSHNLNLVQFECGYNQLTNLDVSQNTELEVLTCSNNLLTSLDVSQTKVNKLQCAYNQLNRINIKNNTIAYNFFSQPIPLEINFSSNGNLEYICADDEDVSLVAQKIIDEGYTYCHVNEYCTLTPSGAFYEITGITKFDSDFNGCNLTDIDYSNLKINFSNGVNLNTIFANNIGIYFVPAKAENYVVTPVLENPSYFNISPSSFIVNFPAQVSPFTQDFCVTANGIKHDVEVLIMPTTPARPGFDADYKIVYRNKGNQVENGNITLIFDDAVLDYVSSNPVHNSSASNTFTWNYTNLQPFETREIEISFNLNGPTETPAVNNDDVLNYTATISTSNTDETPTDNTFILNQTVVGSYDPNDKKCLEGKTVGPSMIGEYVHYVIRFENTGTFPAENIVVKDMIDLTKFDIATLVPLKGSHEFYTRIKNNKVEFIFENINLDFNNATNDGFIAFKIKTKPTLVIGNTFSNNATIYFDYNFPITTNTYTTTIAALKNQSFEFGSEFALYPNPAKDILNIQSKKSLDIKSIEIYNLLGQIVLAVPNSSNAIDVSSLKTGTYFVKVNTEKGSSNIKFVKE